MTWDSSRGSTLPSKAVHGARSVENWKSRRGQRSVDYFAYIRRAFFFWKWFGCRLYVCRYSTSVNGVSITPLPPLPKKIEKKNTNMTNMTSISLRVLRPAAEAMARPPSASALFSATPHRSQGSGGKTEVGHGGSEGVRNGDLRGGVVRGKFDDEVPDPQVARVSGAVPCSRVVRLMGKYVQHARPLQTKGILDHL